LNAQPDRALPVAVIGAGVVGMACAVALRRRGHDTVVFDRLPPGEACSYGNSGGMPRGHAMPMAVPGIIWRVPRYLSDPLGSLAIRPGYLPVLAPWLLHFLRASRTGAFRSILDHLSTLMHAGYPAWDRLLAEIGAGDLICEAGAMTLYRNGRAREQAMPMWRELKARGADFTLLDRNALNEAEPAVPAGYTHAVHEPDYRFARDPYALVCMLAEHFTALGGSMRREEICDIIPEKGGVRLRGTKTQCMASQVVVAAGAWSGRLLAPLGHRVRLEAGRGYHVMLPQPGVWPTHAMFIPDRQISFTPMRNGLRVSGNVEFAGLGSAPNWRRPDRQIEKLRALYPQIGTEGHTKWAGDRPMMPDSLPVLERRGRLVFAFGHGQYGLALAAITAELVAELVAGQTPALDLHPFRLDRSLAEQ